MSLVAANRYAKALADLALDPKMEFAPEAMAGQLESVEQALAESPDLRNVLLSPAVTPVQKRAVVSRLAGPLGLHPLIKNLLYVLIDHRRTPLLSEIREAVREQVDERLGIVRAGVSAAQPLSGEQRTALEAKLRTMTGRDVRCEYRSDASLLGGVSVRIGSSRYDGSARGQLDALRRRLARPV